MQVEFTVLGTGSANPQLDRHPSAYLVSLDNELILLDCGEGTQYRLLQYRVKHARLRHIFITHLHGDHYFGLIGLLSSFNLNGRTEPLTIIGPYGLSEIITLQLKYSQTALRFPVHFIETNPTEAVCVYEHPLFTVTTLPLVHRVPCTGYLIETQPAKRKLCREKLPENFPIPWLQSLKNGQDVTDELTGTTYLSADYTLEGDKSKRLAYCSDTAYYEPLIPLVEGVDLLFHEATFQEAEVLRAEQTYHATAKQAAQIAAAAQVKHLVIGHYSSRYKEIDTHLAEAKSVFAPTSLAIEGKTFMV